MNILLHTIALEPARWTPERVSRPLSELLPTIAGAGFFKLEIFEPHLALLPDEEAIKPLLEGLHLVPMVLSSYLDVLATDETFARGANELLARVDRFGFVKVRLFAGKTEANSDDASAIKRVAQRVGRLAAQRPEVEFLFETHDGTLAAHPLRAVDLIRACDAPNVGLLWQPAEFDPDLAWIQWGIQRSYIRHIHLQNRDATGAFCRLGNGVIPWKKFLEDGRFEIDVSLEFVPSGICSVEDFDLTTSVQEAVDEFGYVVSLEN